MKRIGIIGAGNIGGAIAEGLALNERYKSQLLLSLRHQKSKSNWESRGFSVAENNVELCGNSDIIILAVKPHHAHDVLSEIDDHLDGKVLISIVTGLSLKDLGKYGSENTHFFCAMPNTAIALGQSMTCISTSSRNETLIQAVVAVFNELGETVIVDDELMQASTVMAACGIAYALRYIRAQTQAGIEIGFSADVAQKIAAQTAKGAATLLLENHSHPEEEIDKVTTPKGCTIVGLNEMEHQGFSSSLIRGVLSSYRKIDEIG
jgi:pyrroline-5-carboxylate reductase